MPDNFKINNTIIKLIKDDMTLLDTEAFVFYARPNLSLGSGYGNAISTRGGPSIKAELDKIGSIMPYQAIATKGGNLKAKYIIHAAGPVFQEADIENKLTLTIMNALKCADENGVTQLAFPLMGVGFYGITPDASFKVMLEGMKKFLNGTTSLKEILIVANDNRELRLFSQKFANFN